MSSLAIASVGLQRTGRWILRNISLQFHSGSVLAIIGPNGSGKSTLLRCMSGIWRATLGQVMLDGRPLEQLRRSEIARTITYVPQETRMEFDFPVRDIVRMGRYAHRGRFDRETGEDRRIVAEALLRADVAHLADRSITHLSGGERQRVLIARSLATRAEILLLDEPTANLDVDHSLDVLELCRSLAGDGHAIAIATHDLNAVYRLANEVALLDSGELTAAGRPHSVLNAETLERAFHVRAETLTGSDGTPLLLFHRLAETRTNP